jgi:hypothetical protein
MGSGAVIYLLTKFHNDWFWYSKGDGDPLTQHGARKPPFIFSK